MQNRETIASLYYYSTYYALENVTFISNLFDNNFSVVSDVLSRKQIKIFCLLLTQQLRCAQACFSSFPGKNFRLCEKYFNAFRPLPCPCSPRNRTWPSICLGGVKIILRSYLLKNSHQIRCSHNRLTLNYLTTVRRLS